MDVLTEDVARLDMDTEMAALTPDDFTEQNLEGSDEVEILRNSLREAVHDDNVRPKMQCLMMDSSFSMVTMQGEDSGIAWETTPSRCTTPWASEAGNFTVDLSSPVAVRPATPGSAPAGKITFVMDEELISRRKKTKERVNQKSKGDRLREVAESSGNISGRPELVEFSQPNVKTEEGDEEEANDPLVDKEQKLFRLVSEGSEILNIVVPPKFASVDEEESKEMVDNLSYLEESLLPKASEETHDELVFTGPDAAGRDQVKPSSSISTNLMDPPGAPVARPLGRGATGNVDYFEAFTMVDAEAPGSPAVITQGLGEQETETEAATEIQDTEKPVQSVDNTTTTLNLNDDNLDTISLEEINSSLLDEVFYGSTDNSVIKTLDKEGGCDAPSRLPSKPSGSNLFGSQEDILTPIFLPEGPRKIIDQILLEEPKAMAFLYDDLYEEAIGSRKKEEDTESMTSEKSFHSRHSDREARGYLEKYVLIDETPAVEVEPTDKEKCPEEGPRVLSQDLYELGDLLSEPEKGEMPDTEEEITDFLRTCDNSSPCDIDPFPQSLEEDETQSITKTKVKTDKNVSIKVEKVAKIPEDPLSVSSFEFLSEELDWGTVDDRKALDDKETVTTDQELWKKDLEMQRPVAPPRRKATSSPKTCLDLTPLTPVDDIMQEKEEAGGKEQRVEEKETASPAEPADEGDADGEETMPSFSDVALFENALAAVESPQTESVEDCIETAVRNTSPAAAQEKETKTVEEKETSETEAAIKQTEPEEVEIQSSAKTENPEKQGDNSTAPAKEKGQCVIL